MAEDKGFAPKLSLTNVGKSSSKKEVRKYLHSFMEENHRRPYL